MIIQKNILILCISSLLLLIICCSQSINKNDHNSLSIAVEENNDQVDCNWCGTSEVPDNVSWRTIIPLKGELGEKIIISGIVYMPDKKTPAKDIIVYVYHTNKEGIYPKLGDEKGNGKYHGHLRGWMKTDSNGKYEFETIRPAPYPNHEGEPAHIHYVIQGTEYPEYWLASLWFADDLKVTDDYLKSVKRSGGFSNVVTLIQDENNDLRGERNIVLERFE